jgi:hypothetical protein
MPHLSHLLSLAPAKRYRKWHMRNTWCLEIIPILAVMCLPVFPTPSGAAMHGKMMGFFCIAFEPSSRKHRSMTMIRSPSSAMGTYEHQWTLLPLPLPMPSSSSSHY